MAAIVGSLIIWMTLRSVIGSASLMAWHQVVRVGQDGDDNVIDRVAKAMVILHIFEGTMEEISSG